MASAGVIPGLLKLNHNIKDYLDLLTDGKVGDQKLTGLLSDIRPYVESLAAIDDYGQELRYHMNRDKQESLSDRPLANIAVIHDSVLELSEIIRDLKYRTEDFLSERTTGTYTDQCSRSDLKAIAELLPV